MFAYINLAAAIMNVCCGLPAIAIINIVAAAGCFAVDRWEANGEIEAARKLRESLTAR